MRRKSDLTDRRDRGWRPFLAPLVILASLFLIPFVFETAGASPEGEKESKPEVPFWAGERLTYEISWFGIDSGKAVMEVKEKLQMGQREVYHIVSTAQSNDFISFFYPVDDRVESFVDAEGLYSYNIKVHQREGKRVREKSIVFDQVNHRAVQIKHNEKQTFDIPPRVQDSLSSLYYFRTKDGIAVGKSVFIDVHESEKNWQLEIKVLGKEKVTTPVGTFNTLKVQALVRYEGLFMDKGDVFIWFTDDEKKVPVLVKGKIKIGSITATLISRQEGFLATREGKEEIQTAGASPGPN
jgi:hypothetical protein